MLAAAAPPPPPPLSSSPPLHAVLRPPPPPPPPPSSHVQSRPQSGRMQFIPHQINRQPPRPPMRPNFIPMRAMHMGGPPVPFPSHGAMGPFGPHMGQHPHQMHGPPMPHMGPGHMSMVHGPMPMPHQMGNMGLHMPPGFCPPGAAPPMVHGSLPCDTQAFMPRNGAQDFDPSVSVSSSESASVVAAAPAIYAAPFVKSQIEDILATSNGQEISTTSTTTPATPKLEKWTPVKSEEHVVGL